MRGTGAAPAPRDIRGMVQAFAYERDMEEAEAPPSPRARRLLALAWASFCVAVLLLMFPFRYTSHTELSFDVAAQPTPAAIRGVTQLLTSREMAFDVIRGLGAADAAVLASDGTPFPFFWRAGEGEDAAVRARAARTLTRALAVTAQQGGRTLDITVSLANPTLAARVADAYAAALLALDASVRGPGEAARDPSPAVRLAHAATLVRLPDAPDPGRLLLLALATGLVCLANTRLRARRMVRHGPIDNQVLPREIKGDRRVVWLRSASDAGLGPDEAVDRLADHLQHAGDGLVVLTSGDQPAHAAACALALARRLSESEDQVVLVALDGAVPQFSELVADPRAPGVAELLFGVAGFSEAIHRDAHSRAHIIPPGRDSRGGPSVVNADRLTLIVQSLRQTYGRVVVSAPTLAGTPGAERLAALGPVLVAMHADDGATAGAVETYDALAAKGFTHVVMLPLRPEPEDADGGAGPNADITRLPIPTLQAQSGLPASAAA